MVKKNASPPEKSGSGPEEGSPETVPESGILAPVAADWSARVVKWGVVKPGDLPAIADAFLKYVFPEESVKKTESQSMKKQITGYNAQYVINALNEVIGPGNWREYGESETKMPGKAYVTIYHGTFEIGNWKTERRKSVTRLPDGTVLESDEPVAYFEVLARYSHVGGSRNMDEWESIKGSRTNFLKKVCSYIGNGWRSYALAIDEDLTGLWYEEDAKKSHEPPRQAPKPYGKPAPAPEEDEAPKPMTDKQRSQIDRIVLELVDGDADAAGEKIKTIEGLVKKPFDDFTEGNANEVLRVLKTKFEQKMKEKFD